MAATHRSKVMILGSGPAGYTAAIYAARANLKPMLVQGIQPGGQLTITTDVENYPGFADVIQGPWLMDQMQKQAEHVGTQLFFDTIVEVDVSRRPFVCLGDSGDRYEADALVIAATRHRVVNPRALAPTTTRVPTSWELRPINRRSSPKVLAAARPIGSASVRTTRASAPRALGTVPPADGTKAAVRR